VEEEASEVPAETIPESQLQEQEARAAETQEAGAATPSAADVQAAPDPESWRREVAVRLSHYRARRRPREPRYPSLQLKFDTEPVWSDPVVDAAPWHAPAGVDEPLPSTPLRSACWRGCSLPPFPE